jgi:two-component system NtrC family sensor kinase
MRVRVKVTILLGLLFTGLLAAQWSIQQRLVLPKFVELERESARTDMQRVVYAVEREEQSLGAQAADWGNWNDTWNYMRRHFAAYEHDTLTDTAVKTLKVDYLALVASDGRLTWSRALDPLTRKILATHLNRTDRLEDEWSRALSQGHGVSGLVATDGGVLIASGAPILDGFGHGPSRGMVIMGRFLNNAELLRLGNQAQVKLDMRICTGQEAAGSTTAAKVRAGDIRLTETPSTTRIERAFANLEGEPLLIFGISVPRTISHRGAEAVQYSTRMVAAAAGIALIMLLLLLGRMVLSPLASVTDHAQRIASADDLSARLAYERSDELGTLAKAFDNMVERLAQTRRELVDRSFESGAAENASGVLHNLGNAMTPLSVNVASLQKQLGDMSVDDLQTALRELQDGTVESERRRDLLEFLQLSVGELRRTQIVASARLSDVIEQAGVIQAVLAEQRQLQRSGPVLLSMTPAELVSLSLQQVAAAHLARLELDISPRLAAIGTLSLPCTTLGMVLQNLIQNAAEAAAGAGRERARLRIDAEMLSADDHRLLRFSISDDAAGVDPQDLPKLFQKGYSTKSRATNSGLGLHWCANTLNALGGSITAQSEGLGRGACFEILVPLRTANGQLEKNVA